MTMRTRGTRRDSTGECEWTRWIVVLHVRDAALEGGGGFGGGGGARANADDVRSGRLVRVPERGRVRPVVSFAINVTDTRGKRDGVGRKGERGVTARRRPASGGYSANFAVALFPPHDDANDAPSENGSSNDSLHILTTPNPSARCFMRTRIGAGVASGTTTQCVTVSVPFHPRNTRCIHLLPRSTRRRRRYRLARNSPPCSRPPRTRRRGRTLLSLT